MERGTTTLTPKTKLHMGLTRKHLRLWEILEKAPLYSCYLVTVSVSTQLITNINIITYKMLTTFLLGVGWVLLFLGVPEILKG